MEETTAEHRLQQGHRGSFVGPTQWLCRLSKVMMNLNKKVENRGRNAEIGREGEGEFIFHMIYPNSVWQLCYLQKYMVSH